jgi:hypothetical protein
MLCCNTFAMVTAIDIIKLKTFVFDTHKKHKIKITNYSNQDVINILFLIF